MENLENNEFCPESTQIPEETVVKPERDVVLQAEVSDDDFETVNEILVETPEEEMPSKAPEQYIPAPEEKRSGQKWLVGVLVAIIALGLLAGSCLLTATLINGRWETKMNQMGSDFDQKLNDVQQALEQHVEEEPPMVTMPHSGILPAPEEGLTPAEVYNRNVQAVVAVTNQGTANSFFGQVQTSSFGTGFLISEDGYVVTNYHVAEGATTLTVRTYDEKDYSAQLIGFDSANDLAVLKIEGSGFPFAAIGSSDELVVGDQVVAIGNPLGELTATLTVGYVSAKDRMVDTDGKVINMLQTDAAINSGNSGGPLFNMKGQVIGITTAKFSGTSNSGASIEGIGFAVPIDDVIGMIEDLCSNGYISGAYLGVEVKDVDETAQSYGLPAGAYVKAVLEGVAADRAGVLPQDIIVDLGGIPITSLNDLTRALRKFKSGDSTTITVYRKGQQITLDIVLDEKPQQQETQESQPQETQTPQQGYGNPFFGG